MGLTFLNSQSSTNNNTQRHSREASNNQVQTGAPHNLASMNAQMQTLPLATSLLPPSSSHINTPQIQSPLKPRLTIATPTAAALPDTQGVLTPLQLYEQ